VLDEAHRREGTAVKAAANRRPVLVDHAATLPQVDAASVCAPLRDQFAIGVPLRQQVGQAFPIAFLVHGNARVIAAGRAVAARDWARVAAPARRYEVLPGAAH
jgi:hypothetical protein